MPHHVPLIPRHQPMETWLHVMLEELPAEMKLSGVAQLGWVWPWNVLEFIRERCRD
jgi:hypothetical protein